jgi:hypothetical protein
VSVTAYPGRRHRRRPVLRRAVLAAVGFTGLFGLLSAGAVAYVYQKYDGQLHRVSAPQTKDPNIKDAAEQARAENFLIIGWTRVRARTPASATSPGSARTPRS